MGFFKKNFLLFIYVFPLIFPINLLSNTTSQLLSRKLDALLQDPRGQSHQEIWIYGGASLLISILFPILLTTITLWGIQNRLHKTPVSLGNFIKIHLEPLIIELLRCWGRSMLWGILFIVPGIIALFFYNLVPYIVVLSGDYRRGKIDALKTSSTLIRKRIVSVFVILFLFNILLPLFSSAVFDEYYNVFTTPIAALSINCYECYFVVFAGHLIYYIFQDEPILTSQFPDLSLQKTS